MEIRLSSDVLKSLKTLKQKDSKLFTQINKQLKLFKENPKHVSLRLHKLSGKLENCWSISINRSFRMVYVILEKDIVYFIFLGTHDEVYRK